MTRTGGFDAPVTLAFDKDEPARRWEPKRLRLRILAIAGRIIQRLRPVLMTTATTVLGMLPLVFGLGEGSELQVPLARTLHKLCELGDEIPGDGTSGLYRLGRRGYPRRRPPTP